MFHAACFGFRKRLGLAILLLVVAWISTGCTGISASTPNQSSATTTSNIKINLSPSAATIASGGKQQFVANLPSTPHAVVVWRASGGTISDSGLFTAPPVTSPTKVTVSVMYTVEGTVLSDARESRNFSRTAGSDLSTYPLGHFFATAQVTIVPLAKLAISSTSLAAGTSGVPYNAGLTASGGPAPYRWQIGEGTLPQGLRLDAGRGIISGIPSQTGTFGFAISATDANSVTASRSLSLEIDPSVTGNFDGPAELPRVYVQSSLADTPTPGNVIPVASGGDFQAAVDSASCGDTILLQAGAVFTGSFNFPKQTCDDGHWIIIRTSAPDSSLPAEGTRLTPCYAGVTSLPGRPALNCTSSNNVLAKLVFQGVGSGPITLENGASHYRFIGLEITRTPGTGVVYNLAFNHGGAADHIIFDRTWFHGTAQDETQRGVMLSGSTYAAVVDSYFSDFHCVAITGACVDSQAIAGGLGNLASGPWKIDGNFLEAAAENILLGGDYATTTPADIEIRYNHMFKPMTWMRGQPGYVGGANGHPFIVKNLFELKNAQRVLLEGNILEYSWGGFSQYGFAIGMGPKNQAIGSYNVCPTCTVTDITIRYSAISHVGGALQLGNGDSDLGGIARAGERYSIHDITIDDIDAKKYKGYGTFAQISMGWRAPVLQDVTINHVTAFEDGIMLNLGDNISVNPAMNNFVYTNNIINAGTAPTKTTGGGWDNCAYRDTPLIVLPKCFESYIFSHNAIVATPSNYPPSQYPSENFFPAAASAVDFVNYNGGNGGNYQLQSTSPYKNAGTDGKDLGADINALQAAIAGVQ